MLSRAEHLKWAKDRALAYITPPVVAEVIASGGKDLPSKDWRRDGQEGCIPMPAPITPKQLSDACASFLSDLGKHPEIDPQAAQIVFAIEAMTGGLNTVAKVRAFIEGTNG